MASFFGVNPFLSPVGQKIEQATDASLPSESWQLNMEVCDLINETEDGPKDAMKAIRKRLTQNAARNFTVIMYTLTVLETCVKNCGRRFHVLVCNKDFLQELIKIIGPKNDPPVAVQEKVLSLVQCWADAFRNIPELSGIVQFYQELKQKVEFPMTDLDSMAPIHTPQRSFPEEPTPPVPAPAAPCPTDLSPATTAALSTDQVGKLTSDLMVVEGNMTVLSEMLSELVPGKEHPSDLQLLQELHTTCQAMQQRLVELINQLSNDEITAELLRVNDGLNNVFLRYNRYEKKRLGSKESPQGEAPQLINLNEEVAGAVGGAEAASISSQLAGLSLSAQLNAHPSVIAASNKDDEFDMFAQSRKVTYESSKSGGSTYEANQEEVLSSSLAQSAQARAQPAVHSERDFDEMAQWLGEKPEESLSSSDFERFLAERAAAAETLPAAEEAAAPSRSTNPPSSTARRQNKPDDEAMFAL